MLLFMVLWFTFGYAPIAHMVWFWMGPDAYTSAAVVDEMNSKAGLIWDWGVLDFAGGTVVHINAGIAGLVGCLHAGQAQRLPDHADGAAQPRLHPGRGRAAVGGLVRLQRRFRRWQPTAPPRWPS